MALDYSFAPSNQEEKNIVVSTSDGCTFWVPKSANALEMKLIVEKKMLRY